MSPKKHKSKSKRLAREIGEVMLALIVAWAGYQGLALVTGTSLPIVAVVSDSMYHDSAFDQWWASHGEFYRSIGIDQTQFVSSSFPNGLSKGDLIFVINQEPEVGDVVIYQRNAITIIHRVIGVRDNGYVIRGDNNPVSDENGASIDPQRIRGKAVVAVPLLGFPRTLIFEIFRI